MLWLIRKVLFVWRVARKAADDFIDDKCPRMAAALAFYMILSLAPLLVIAVAIAGSLFGAEAARGQVSAEVEAIAGPAGAEVVRTLLANAGESSEAWKASLLSAAILLWGASGVFVELQDSLNAVWGVRAKQGRNVVFGFLRDRVLSFGMVLTAGVFMLATLVATGLIGYTSSRLGLEGTRLDGFVDFLLNFAAVTVLFALLFKILPDVRISWRDVWLGAALTAVLFYLGRVGIGYYLGRATVMKPFGAAGSLVVFAVWVYFSAFIFYFGAQVTQSYAFLLRRIEPLGHVEIVPKLSAAKMEKFVRKEKAAPSGPETSPPGPLSEAERG